MPASKKPRKKYVPKAVNLNPVGYVLSGLVAVPKSSKERLLTSMWGAVDAFTTGHGARNEWDNLTSALNIAIVMSEAGFGLEHKPVLVQAQEAAVEVGKRWNSTGKFGLTGPELNTLRHACSVHEAQLDCATVGDIEKAVDEVNKRLRDGNILYRVTPKGSS